MQISYIDIKNGVYPHLRTLASFYQDDGFGNTINIEWKHHAIFHYIHFISQEH